MFAWNQLEKSIRLQRRILDDVITKYSDSDCENIAGLAFPPIMERRIDGRPVCLHVSDVVGVEIPKNKDRVAFKPVKTSKGLRALQVEIIEKFEGEDRVRCPDCGKLVVPRLITYKGEPEKSVYPFCGETIRSFWTISIF